MSFGMTWTMNSGRVIRFQFLVNDTGRTGWNCRFEFQ